MITEDHSQPIAEDQLRLGVKLAPYNPTNLDAVKIAIDMLQLRDTDVVFDLGCGDARFLVSAVKQVPSIQAIGIEYDKSLCQQAEANLATLNVDSTIEIRHANVMDVDLTSGTAFFIYLVPEGLQALKDALVQALRRNARIVTYVFSLRGLTPTKVEIYKGSTKFYLYTQASLES